LYREGGISSIDHLLQDVRSERLSAVGTKLKLFPYILIYRPRMVALTPSSAYASRHAGSGGDFLLFWIYKSKNRHFIITVRLPPSNIF
jgi:hypothetical protein